MSEQTTTEEKKLDALVPKAQADLIKPEPQAGKLSRLAAFTPSTLTEAIALSKLIANSELAPKDFKGKPANVLIAMQMGAEVGLAPMAALQNIAVINGRPSIWGDAALGIVMVHPEYEWHKEWMDGQIAFFTIKRRGQEAYTTKFSQADAVKAGLWGKQGPWQTFPNRMLQMRARGFGIRDKFPDALRGLNIAEEVMDIPSDNSLAAAERAKGALEIPTIDDMRQSAEANRGHNDTGLQRTADEQTQAPAKDNVMCSECRVVNGHNPDCKFYAESAKNEQDRRTSKPTIKAAYLILSVETRRKKVSSEDKKKDPKAVGEPYQVLHVVNPNNDHGKLYVWHKSLHTYLDGVVDRQLLCEVSEGKDKKTGAIFFQLEHILELGTVKFVDGKPAETGSMDAPVEREAGEDDDFDLATD